MVYIFVFPVDIQHHLLRGYNQHPRRENKPYENTSGLDFLFFFKKIRGYPRRKYLEIKSQNINGLCFFFKKKSGGIHPPRLVRARASSPRFFFKLIFL